MPVAMMANPVTSCASRPPRALTIERNVDRGLAVIQISAIKHKNFSDDRAYRKLPPAQVNVMPFVTNRQTIPEMCFVAFTCPDFTLDDFSFWIIVLHNPGGWITLPNRGIVGLPNRSVSGLSIPGRFQCFTKTQHKGWVRPRHFGGVASRERLHRLTVSQARISAPIRSGKEKGTKPRFVPCRMPRDWAKATS